ncbi:hypothetical protein ACBI99_36950 [Nonomuraea sp. ATR24]|uniref:hypothetical protein n=1 Tax=Nonomuraea sp. ATR24 TaxID=1676744 RepID=UPI0035BF6122
MLHWCGGGASLVGGRGLVRRAMRTVGGPRSRRRSGPASTPHAWTAGGRRAVRRREAPPP